MCLCLRKPLNSLLCALCLMCVLCLQVYKALRHGAQPVAVKVLSVSASLRGFLTSCGVLWCLQPCWRRPPRAVSWTPCLPCLPACQPAVGGP
jgi:hypothetical protein